MTALVTLLQIFQALQQSSWLRRTITVFCVVPLYPFLNHHPVDLASSSYFSWTGSSSRHPIDLTVQAARTNFEKLYSQQSQSLVEMTEEYKRRHGRSPPPGFDDWYKFAIKNNVPLIDEYDILTKSIEPYWQINPVNLRDSLKQALSLGSPDLAVLVIKNHTATLNDGNFQHSQLVSLLQPVLPFLPDMTAVLNNLDEPRVVIPHDILSHAAGKTLEHESDGKAHAAQRVSFGDLKHQKTWDTIVLSCSPDSPARSPTLPESKNALDIEFISNVDKAHDICLWPSNKANQHGFLSSTSSLKFTHEYVPILSTAKVSSFQDILMPSSYYFQTDIAEYDDEWDTQWDQKEDVVYWRGSATGGYWSHGSWREGHRQRLVDFVQSPEKKIRLLNETSSGHWMVYNSSIGQLNDVFKVNFSGFFQCDQSDCMEQIEHFQQAPTDTTRDSYKYKILFNLDGNSFSGRYYRFLKSNSLVFMQNLFREWHEDRLFPWVHYVPISSSMEELPEISRYLLQDPKGKIIARQIASDSRDWSRRTLRPVDLSATLLRILLEYNWLLRDDRDTVSPCCT